MTPEVDRVEPAKPPRLCPSLTDLLWWWSDELVDQVGQFTIWRSAPQVSDVSRKLKVDQRVVRRGRFAQRLQRVSMARVGGCVGRTTRMRSMPEHSRSWCSCVAA